MKKILSSLIVVALLFNFIIFPDFKVYAKMNQQKAQIEKEIADYIPKDAEQYMENKKTNILKDAKMLSMEFGLTSEDFDNAFISDPFVVYDLDTKIQEEKIYYPIIQKDTEKVLLVITLFGTTVGWQHGFSQDMVDELNQLEWPEPNCVLYESDGNIVAQTKNEKVNFSNKTILQNFDLKNLDEKKREIADAVEDMEKIDVQEIQSQTINKPIGYSPSFTTELGYYYLNLYNGQGQHGYNICWAAMVATTVNYLKGSNVTAEQVASGEGHNYMALGYQGGTAVDMQNAYKKLGYEYLYYEGQSSFDTIMWEIERKKPMNLCALSSDGNYGHATTLYGYRRLYQGNYIMLWDSALNNSTGGVTVTTYNPNGTVFESNGTNYSWTYTLRYLMYK